MNNKIRRLAKLWKGIIGFVGGGLVFVLCILVIEFVASYMNTYPARRILYSPKTYMPVGETLALYCQSYPLLQSLFETEHDIDLSDTWLPKELGTTGFDSSGKITENSATIYIGNRDLLFAYKLSLDTQVSSAITNVWKLQIEESWFWSPRQHLLTFGIDATRQFTADELLSNVVKRRNE